MWKEEDFGVLLGTLLVSALAVVFRFGLGDVYAQVMSPLFDMRKLMLYFVLEKKAWHLRCMMLGWYSFNFLLL